MTRLRFVKMEGAGNDYVYIDGITQPVDVECAAALATRLADRHFGIGGDGLILLAPSACADVRMVMWNADGSRGAMCGNGLRCLAKLAHDAGHVRGLVMRVETDSGVFDVELRADSLGNVVGARVPMVGSRVATEPSTTTIDGREWSFHAGLAGNPHAVVFVEGLLDELPVERVGLAFQALPQFPDGVNVEFVCVEPPHTLHQRTFERGSGETLACGTGATAAALAALGSARVTGTEVLVHLRGGTLVFRPLESGVLEMDGPATTVFVGEITV